MKKTELMLKEDIITPDQVLKLIQRTPKEHIYRRPARGGTGQWEYVTGTYVNKILNYVFGWGWSFEVVDKGRENNQVWVQGRITIRDKEGKPRIIKEQFGRADIKFRKDGKGMLDYGNDLKSASTDALKKCASLLGIASDIYGKNEFKDIKIDKEYDKNKTNEKEIEVKKYIEQVELIEVLDEKQEEKEPF
jgi:hypothetical protein